MKLTCTKNHCPLYKALIFAAIYIIIGSLIIVIVNTFTNQPSANLSKLIQYKDWIMMLFTALLIFLLFYTTNLTNLWFSQKIKQSNQFNSDISNNAKAIIIQYDLNGKIQFYNKFAQQFYGYTFDEVNNKNIFELLVPTHNPRRTPRKVNSKLWIHRILNDIKTESYAENWNYTKSGKRVFVGWTNKPTYDINNNLNGILSIGIDLTERKIMIDRLTENEKRFKLIFNSVSESITILSKQGNILEMNQAGLDFLGLTLSDIKSNNNTKSIIKNIIPNIDLLLTQVFTKGTLFFETELKSANGQIVASEFFARPIIYMGNEALIAVSRDISERKLFQQRVLTAAMVAEEKERARIAKELHDSVSPILSTAKLYAQTLKNHKAENLRAEICKNLEDTINDSIFFISNISNKLSPHILENFGLTEAIKAFADKIMATSPIKIKITSNLEYHLNTETETTLYRLVTELLNNTLKHAEATNVNIIVDVGNSVNLQYYDNGKGFDQNHIDMFSKGMGMFNLKNRVAGINGLINFYTEPGKGFKVNVEIPIIEK